MIDGKSCEKPKFSETTFSVSMIDNGRKFYDMTREERFPE